MTKDDNKPFKLRAGRFEGEDLEAWRESIKKQIDEIKFTGKYNTVTTTLIAVFTEETLDENKGDS